MLKDLIDFFEDKKILIAGFGREGQSTYKFIRKYLKNKKIFIADVKKDFFKEFEYLEKDKNVECISGENYLQGLENYDIIMKTPGIAFVGMDISSFKDKIKSQLELLLEFFDNTSIGVTGTKGKSTTSSLIYKVLQDQNVKTVFLGNIGKPAFDFLEEIEQDTYIVLEMSSHQLEFMNVSPNISIVTNLYPEHLDHYNSYNDYAKAKCNIFKYQNENDYLIYDYDNENLKPFIENVKSKVYKVSMKENKDISIKNDKVIINNAEIYDINSPRNLIGEYNLKNIMLVLGVSEILKLDLNRTIKSIAEFKTLPHRLEFVGEYDGIKFYDNCIATIPDATIEAVKALKDVDTLIIGGMDRGLDYTDFVLFLDNSNIKNIICMPKTGYDIAKLMKSDKTYKVETLEEAVVASKRLTEKGKICLISPAAASYGFFKNFEEKGDKFKELVKNDCKI